MAEVEIRHDVFGNVVQKKYEAHLFPHTYHVYVCDPCGCLFLANSEGELGWYPDRFEMIGKDGNGCGECECHEIPYMMDPEGNPTEF